MSEDARDMYRPVVRDAWPSKFCESCDVWTDHFADSHKVDELASDVEVKSALAEARSKISKKEQ